MKCSKEKEKLIKTVWLLVICDSPFGKNHPVSQQVLSALSKMSTADLDAIGTTLHLKQCK